MCVSVTRSFAYVTVLQAALQPPGLGAHEYASVPVLMLSLKVMTTDCVIATPVAALAGVVVSM